MTNLSTTKFHTHTFTLLLLLIVLLQITTIVLIAFLGYDKLNQTISQLLSPSGAASISQTTSSPIPTTSPTPPLSATSPTKPTTKKISGNLDAELVLPLFSQDSTYEVTYSLLRYETTDTLVISGQTARPIEGKMFFLVYASITNTSDQALRINTRDYLRLSLNNSDELRAPSIHNDLTQLEPNSTQETRLGFTVNKSDAHFVLHFGAPGNDTQTIPLPQTQLP